MIGTLNSATTVLLINTVLLILSFPFIVCDFYYANNDYSCVWAPIQIYQIKFPLQTWLRVDGATLLAFLVIMIIIGITICVTPGCEWLYSVHAIIGGIHSFFRFAWLIVGAVLFWGYLSKKGICSPNIRSYMFANLIIGFIFLALFFISAFMYPYAPDGQNKQKPHGVIGSGTTHNIMPKQPQSSRKLTAQT